MATVLKCKMCGGDIEVNQDMTVGTCMYCGSTMTLPRIDSEKKARLFNRANQYRLNCEFDKAYDAYETIVEEDEQEAEGYWGMVLSEYGVEYVEDPKTGKRIPTCHRTKVQSVTSSVNYKQALKYADAEGRFMYQDEAEALDKLQKSIISVSAKEKPYDVFICYKETDDATGERTKDSVLAQNIYDALQEKGVPTFFARISLEDKVGQNYEPYIYAALRSAKVMLLVSTSNENCNAIWVKNEWMRFVQFMEEDKNKSIIPACSEMSPYELPDELTGFQAQNMDKVGAIQDLVYGVTKLLGRAPRESNNEIINELLRDKEKREIKTARALRTVGAIAYTLIFAFYVLLLIIAKNSVYNGYTYMTFKELRNRFVEVFNGYVIIYALAVATCMVGLIWGIIKGYTKNWPKRIFTLSYGIYVLASLYARFNGLVIIMETRFTIFIGAGIILVLTLVGAKNEKRKETVLRLAILIAGVIIELIIFRYYEAEPLSSATLITSENQIIVDAEYVNIRQKPSTDSKKLGEVYQGMIFDIDSEVTEGNQTWYEITTDSGKNGYVIGEYVSKPFKIRITDLYQYVNVRSGPETHEALIGKVHDGDVLYAISYDKANRYGWYKVFMDDGTIGYIRDGENIEVINGQE